MDFSYFALSGPNLELSSLWESIPRCPCLGKPLLSTEGLKKRFNNSAELRGDIGQLKSTNERTRETGRGKETPDTSHLTIDREMVRT